MSGLRIAFLDDVHRVYERSAGVAALRGLAGVESVTVLDRHVEDPERLAGFDVLVATRERTQFPADFLRRLDRVKLIVQTGSKAYHVDLAAARDLGITVARAEGASAQSTAELTIGLLIAATRLITRLDADIRAGNWPKPMGRTLSGMRLGLVGFGAVAREVGRLATAFGMSVAAWSPSLLAGRRAAEGVKVLPLPELAASSDVLSVHCALTDETRGLVDRDLIAAMPRGSYLLNSARGPVVDEDALLAALTSGQLAGAGLDVFDREPLPRSHPLRRANVVLTPHIGWITDRSYEAFATAAANLIEQHLDGKKLPSFE
ncbi:MAG: D-2-hydroxyacid dehydrogenase family protein [Micromonosporaceae bacterium]|nr:D-2-hydroxyacid dehydrogenase family protein [Micromonosporaceae bacterium]